MYIAEASAALGQRSGLRSQVYSLPGPSRPGVSDIAFAMRCSIGKGGVYSLPGLEIGSGVRIVAVWEGRRASVFPSWLAVGNERHSLCAGPRVAHGIQGELLHWRRLVCRVLH